MEILRVEDLSFYYPGTNTPAVKNISFCIGAGEFLLVCGASGCGKTTLLKMLKNELTPAGKKSGKVLYNGENITTLSIKQSAQSIGFVMQNPENQIVTDKVWHELAFGLENLGVEAGEIRRRVAETANFFGINEWYSKKTDELSGGQKQILNLASVCVMRPQIIILDEPTSMLDPIAATEFLSMLKRLNTELGVTVIISEHRLEEVFPIADRVLCMENAQIVALTVPAEVYSTLHEKNCGKSILPGLPAAVRIFGMLGGSGSSPVSVKDGKNFISQNYLCSGKAYEAPVRKINNDTALCVKNVWFRYEKKEPDILRGVNIEVKKGEIFSLLGGNGAGKTTLLNAIAALCNPYRGSIKILDKKLGEYKNNSLYKGVLAYLPQEPQTLFCRNSIQEELDEAADRLNISKDEKEQTKQKTVELTEIKPLLQKHPYDLSGGEQQKCALAKVLMPSPKLLLLDEPTKGLDAAYKKRLGELLIRLKNDGKTVFMVTHDVEFAAVYADTCALFFNGEVFNCATPESFFSGLTFYTTAACRIAGGYYKNAVTAEAVAEMCRKNKRYEE